MNEINWLDILDSLEADNCILFVGPYAFQDQKNQSIEKALYNYLELDKVDTEQHRRIKRYYEEEGLFFLKRQGYQNNVAKEIRTFYENEFQPQAATLEKIAQIPFSLIMTLTPDKFIKNTFENPEIKLPFYHDFYDKGGAIPKEYIKPTGAKPLIYNLMGYIGKEESLILTHDNLFDYLESFFAKNTMHDNLKAYIQNAHAYIFLGLPIDKWYTQLLLRILKLNKKSNKELERLSATHDNFNPIIFKDQFHFNITNLSADNFIDELFKVCQSENLLKEVKSSTDKPLIDLAAIKTLIANAEVETAIEELEHILVYHQPRSNELLDDLIGYKNRLNQLETNQMRGIEMNYDTKKNIFTKDYLDFLSNDVASQLNDIII